VTVSARVGVRVPSDHRPAFQALAHLDDPSFESLASALDSPRPTLSLSTLRDRIRSSVAAGSGQIEPDLLMEALIGASSATTWIAGDRAETAHAIVASLGEEPSSFAGLVERLARLLESASLGHLAKGLDVLTEHERIYLKSRMLTDIRPVYEEEETGRPAGFVLVHTLRLDVRIDGRARSVYVSMDESDLKQLSEVLNREVEKTDGIRVMIDGLGLELLDFGDAEIDDDRGES
jgi:hypothetical protein